MSQPPPTEPTEPTEPEGSEPEGSEPEGSEPEGSEPEGSEPSPETVPDPRMMGPGCGLGAYAILLMGTGALAMAFVFTSTLSIIIFPDYVRADLLPGYQVPVWKLQPMRDAGVLGLTDVPAAYHDESSQQDGSEACALMPDRVVRVADEQGTSLALARIEEVRVTEEDENILVETVAGDTVLPCLFGPGEGGDRFARQLQVEAKAQSAEAEAVETPQAGE